VLGCPALWLRLFEKRVWVVNTGLVLPLPLPRNGNAAGNITTCFFDGDLWMDANDVGLSVYRYAGPVPESEKKGVTMAERGVVGKVKAGVSLVARVLAIAAMVSISMVVVVPVLAFTVLILAAANVVQVCVSVCVWVCLGVSGCCMCVSV
jgi:hypothetical protein